MGGGRNGHFWGRPQSWPKPWKDGLSRTCLLAVRKLPDLQWSFSTVTVGDFRWSLMNLTVEHRFASLAPFSAFSMLTIGHFLACTMGKCGAE